MMHGSRLNEPPAAAGAGGDDVTSHRGLTVAARNDYDKDDGLIEIGTLPQLNAVRWDLDGKDESVDIGHAASTATPSEYTGVSDDFEAAAITLLSASVQVNEQDTATYTLALATQPTGW